MFITRFPSRISASRPLAVARLLSCDRRIVFEDFVLVASLIADQERIFTAAFEAVLTEENIKPEACDIIAEGIKPVIFHLIEYFQITSAFLACLALYGAGLALDGMVLDAFGSAAKHAFHTYGMP